MMEEKIWEGFDFSRGVRRMSCCLSFDLEIVSLRMGRNQGCCGILETWTVGWASVLEVDEDRV